MNKILYPKIYWWLLLLLPFVFFGFYPSYFALLLNDLPGIFHFHAVFMSLWVITAIVQPFLIRYKKLRLHRFIGKLSYVFMPFVVLSAYLIIRRTYYTIIGKEMEQLAETNTAPAVAPHVVAGDGLIIGVVYMFWLTIFYTLAIINRKKMVPHATYMLAAILTLLGPSVDRLLFQVHQYFGWGFNLFAETFVFFVILLLLGGLYLYQRRRGISTRPVRTAFIIYFTGQVLYFVLPLTRGWSEFMRLIMY